MPLKKDEGFPGAKNEIRDVLCFLFHRITAGVLIIVIQSGFIFLLGVRIDPANEVRVLVRTSGRQKAVRVCLAKFIMTYDQIIYYLFYGIKNCQLSSSSFDKSKLDARSVQTDYLISTLLTVSDI